MSTARVTSLVLEVLAPDSSAGVSTARASGSGGVRASSSHSASSSARISGSGRTIARGGAASGGSVTYAEIIDGRVTGIYTGSLPASSATVLYIDLTGYSTPSVGDYFSEICQTFSSTEPTVDPGDIVPPWTKPRDGTNGKDGTNGLDGGVGPFPPASVVPTLIAFHADGKDSVTTSTSAAAALFEVSSRLRTAFDLSDACAIRVQGKVTTALAGAELVLCYSTDDGATWDYVADAYATDAGGPWMSIASTGEIRGDFRNVTAGARGDVLLSLFTRYSVGGASAIFGNIGALVYLRTDLRGMCASLTPAACPVFPTLTPGPSGELFRDDFSSYATDDALRTSSNFTAYTPGFTRPARLYRCTDDTGASAEVGAVNTANSATLTHVEQFGPVPPPSGGVWATWLAANPPSGTECLSLWVRHAFQLLASYPVIVAPDTYDYDPFGGYGYLVGYAATFDYGDTSGATTAAVYDQLRKLSPTWPSLTQFVNSGGNLSATPSLESAVDVASYIAQGDHDVIVNHKLTVGTPGQIESRVWDNGVLVAHTVFAGDLDRGFMQATVATEWSLDPRSFGLKVSRLLEMYNGDVTSDPYGYGEV